MKKKTQINMSASSSFVALCNERGIFGLVCIHASPRAQVREMPNLMVMGQQEFIATVEKPHSKRLNHFVQKYMKYHVRNLFRQVRHIP